MKEIIPVRWFGREVFLQKHSCGVTMLCFVLTRRSRDDELDKKLIVMTTMNDNNDKQQKKNAKKFRA